MLYLLYEALRRTEATRFLNFLKYPSFRIVAAGVASLVLGMLIGPQLIDRLRFTQHGQSNVREDTPERHQIKSGTPTMGGVLILICIAASTFVFADLSQANVPKRDGSQEESESNPDDSSDASSGSQPLSLR